MDERTLIPAINLVSQYASIKDEVDLAISEVLHSGNFILGQHVKQFESTLASYCQCDYALGVASGSDALLLSLMALNIGTDDEIITTPFTYFATAGTINRVGAKPIFVDIEWDTFNIDVSKIETRITPKTKAIIPVHLFGHPSDMIDIMKIAKQYHLHVIEDAAQAIGSRINEKKVGGFGDLAAGSFFPTKNLGAYGDGGIVLTNSIDMNNQIDILRRQGATQKNYHEFTGINSRLDELQAAILNVKIKHLDDWIMRRRVVAEYYEELLSGTHLILPVEKQGYYHIYHQYTLRVRSRRDELCSYLADCGIEAVVYYPYPLHLQPAFNYLGYKQGDFPICEEVCTQVLSLPCYPELTKRDQEYIAKSIKVFLGSGN